MHCKKDVRFCVILVLLLLSVLVVPTMVQAALVAQYHLDTGSGTTATDSSGYGNNGTISGASWVQLPSGYCLSFDGVNDYVDCGNNSSMNFSNSVTMVGWVCPWANQLADGVGVFGRGNSPGDARYLLTYYYNNYYWFYINTGGGIAAYTNTAPGVWNQVAVTYDRTAGYLKIYINGEFKSQYAYNTAITSNSLNFYIGACTSTSYQFKGLIDEVNVYNTALSATEVANLYSSSTRDTYNGMVGYTSGGRVNSVEDGQVAHYNCNEGTGTTLNDIGGYMNTGTLGSSSMWSANSSPNDGYSLSFNGTTSQKVTCGTKNGYDITGPITVMTWINPDASQAVTDSGLVGKGTSQYLLGYHSNGGNTVRFYINSSSTYVTSSAITAGTWTHVAATYDKSNIKIYINGSYVTQTAYTSAISSGASTNLMLGCTDSAGTNPFKGKMDEVRVYNRALSASEISARYAEDSDSRNGMVAHYKFDEGTGNKAADSTGHGNTGTLTGCTWSKYNYGSVVHFNGTSDFIDCGTGSSLNITSALTMVAWVNPDSGQISSNEPGILGKRYPSYLMSLYKNSQVWDYINSGGNAVLASVAPGNWSQVVTTYDGTWMKMFINGTLADKRKIPGTPPVAIMSDPDYSLLIGKNRDTGDFFLGYIDDVKIYNRALSDSEAIALFSSTDRYNRNAMFDVACSQITAVQSITSGNVTVKAGANGGFEVDNGSNNYFVWSSSFSYPGTSIGHNVWSETNFGGETGWSATVTKPSSTRLVITGSGTKYSISRQIDLVTRNGAPCVTVQDTITNTSAAAIGTLIDHTIITPYTMGTTFSGTAPSNSMVFFSQNYGDWGIVGEDDLGRLQFNSSAVACVAGIHHRNFGLDVSGSYTFKYAIYPLAATGDMFNFINQVRKDWGANITIDGPFRPLDIADSDTPWNNTDDLKKWIHRRNLNFVSLNPCLDYDPGISGGTHVFSKSEYLAAMTDYVARLKVANPNIKCIGPLESDWVNIAPDNHTDPNLPMFTQADGDTIKGYFADPPTSDITQVASAIANTVSLGNLKWTDPYPPYTVINFADSIKRRTPGLVALDHYLRYWGGSFYDLSTYMAPNNGQYNYMMNQATFIMDTCGMDGYYIDEFNQAWNGTSFYSYGNTGELQWDGKTVNIDPATGNIKSSYGKAVDCSYIGITPRVNLINAATSRSKKMLANTYSTSPEEQSLGCIRMSETFTSVKPEALSAGVEPFFDTHLLTGSLNTPVGYGVMASTDTSSSRAEGLMLCMMKYLRHGMVYYHAVYPELDSSDGEYGPINHMMPITPQELHKGWIKGNERIITGISISNVSWNNSCVAPLVHFFDIHGREISANAPSRQATITGTPGAWDISITLSNWSEFCVVEQSDGLIAKYKFDEGSGGVAIDSSGNGNTATINNPRWISSNGGNALYFDGQRSYIDCGNSAILDQKGPITLSAWVAPSLHQNATDAAIVGKGFGSYLLTYYISGGTTGYSFFYITTGSNGVHYQVPYNTWSLITATFDGTSLKMYVNGTLQATNTSLYNYINSNPDQHMYIGCQGVSNGLPIEPFKGYMDDVRVYNRALSQTEISAMYSSTEKNARDTMFTNGAEDGLVVHYKMNEGSGTTLADCSGFGNNATISGASWLDVSTGNYALDFDGVTSYVDCGNGASLDQTGPITTVSWVCPWSTQFCTDPGIFGKGYGSYLLTYIMSGSTGYAFSYITTGSNGVYYAMPYDTWSQLVTTFDGTYLKMYINGTLQSTNTSLYNYINSNPTQHAYIGCQGLSSGSPVMPFRGVVDEIKMYDYAMSSTEVASLYSSSERTTRNNMFNNGVEDSKVVHYTMSEGSGSTIADSSGHRNNATLSNVSWTTRKTGVNALNFNGTTAFADCGNGLSLNLAGPMTSIAWVYPNSSQNASDPGILGKGYGSYLFTYLISGGSGYSFFYINTGSNAVYNAVPTNTWSQIAASFDGTYLRYYVNGVLQNTNTSLYNYINAYPSQHMYLGCNGLSGSNPNQPFAGRIGEVKIYNRALSDTEISNLYNP